MENVQSDLIAWLIGFLEYQQKKCLLDAHIVEHRQGVKLEKKFHI